MRVSLGPVSKARVLLMFEQGNDFPWIPSDEPVAHFLKISLRRRDSRW